MMDKIALINSIKDACMVIGLRKKGTEYPEEIHGTGFTVDPEGFVITAQHVIKGVQDRLKELNIDGENYELTASFLQYDGEIPSLITTPIKEKRNLVLFIKDLMKYLPQDHDLNICRIYGKWGKLPYLKLMKPTRLKVYQDILMCGYPRGKGTLNIFDFEHGMRLSPVIQTGKISSLMPSDRTIRPFGLITDIIGVGGSSGSPITNADGGEVLGIAQHVVPASVFDKNDRFVAEAKMGLVWGVTTYFLYDMVYRMIEEQKKIIDEMGNPIVPKGHVIKLTFKAGEGSFPDLPPSKS